MTKTSECGVWHFGLARWAEIRHRWNWRTSQLSSGGSSRHSKALDAFMEMSASFQFDLRRDDRLSKDQGRQEMVEDLFRSTPAFDSGGSSLYPPALVSGEFGCEAMLRNQADYEVGVLHETGLPQAWILTYSLRPYGMCGGWDSNPRTPKGWEPQSHAVDHAGRPPREGRPPSGILKTLVRPEAFNESVAPVETVPA